MNFQLILFYLLAAIILFGALKTVTVKNPVHAALYLVLTFCMSAMMWMLMQAEFLGITLVVVYVGAVMVLFLFVVMMLNIDVEEMRKGFWRNAPVAAVVGVLMAVALIMILVAPDTDLAAFGQMEVTACASGRLGRVDDLDDPAAQPGSGLDPADGAPESSESASDDAEPTAS